jgi:hypothetical protein
MSDVFVLDDEGNVKQSGGGAGVTDHGALTGLSDDDHSQYLLADGSRAMAGDLELGSNELVVTEQGSTPSTPDSNKRKLYPKADGWYDLDDTGQESGPLGGAVLPFNHRAGLGLRKLSAAEILIETGSVGISDTLVEKKDSTVLNLGTAGDWIGDSSLEAASMWVSVYVDASGNLKLYDTLPLTPEADTGCTVCEARANQSGWDGTASNGLNETSVVIDDGYGSAPSDKANIEVGMYLGVYTDSGYTQGRGKGSGASGSKQDMSFALITAFNSGTNTLTLEAGHQIAMNDNDYLMVLEAGAPLFRQVSGTWYRWLGALWNDSSADLTENSNKQAQYTCDEASNYSTSSTSFVPVDSTNLALTLITSGKPVQIGFQGYNTYYAYWDIQCDSSWRRRYGCQCQRCGYVHLPLSGASSGHT